MSYNLYVSADLQNQNRKVIACVLLLLARRLPPRSDRWLKKERIPVSSIRLASMQAQRPYAEFRQNLLEWGSTKTQRAPSIPTSDTLALAAEFLQEAVKSKVPVYLFY